MEREYKTLKNVRAFNEANLVGNLGGYIELFLGIALWSIPDIIESMVMRFKVSPTKEAN